MDKMKSLRKELNTFKEIRHIKMRGIMTELLDSNAIFDGLSIETKEKEISDLIGTNTLPMMISVTLIILILILIAKMASYAFSEKRGEL